MSRRLGDDPLARAKNARAVQAARVQSGAVVAVGSRNDVFFQTKTEVVDVSAPNAIPARPVEAPEISEVSELPQIREANAMPIVDVVQPPGPARPASSTEPVVTRSPLATAQIAAPAQQVAPEPEPAKAEPEADKGGLLKRLFGKL